MTTPNFENVEEVKELMARLESETHSVRRLLKENRESASSYMLWIAGLCDMALQGDPTDAKRILSTIKESMLATSEELRK